MNLPKEIENYRNVMSSQYLFSNTPQIISYKWHTEIEPAKLYALGEQGAHIFLKRRKSLSEKNLILFALQAEYLGHIEMANGFWRQAYLKSLEQSSPKTIKSKSRKNIKEEKKNSASFQEMLFSTFRVSKKYNCHAIFLVLPSSQEAKRYLESFYEELQIISNPNTLIMIVGSSQSLQATVGDETFSIDLRGEYSKIIQAFRLEFPSLPCMVVFEGINTSKGVHIFLKGMTAEEISEKMLVIFSEINKSIKAGTSPIDTLQDHKRDENLKHGSKEIIGNAFKIFNHPLTQFLLQESLTRMNKPTS